MARLSIHLLGSFQVTLDGEVATGFESDKVRALLAYVSIAADKPHRREALAGLFWPEVPEQSARASLRNALANLRQVIGDRDASPPFLHITRQTIQVNKESDYWLDVVAVTALLSDGKPSVDNLEEAVSLYRGELLEGFSIPDAAAFEEWLLLKREQMGRQLMDALRDLVVAYEARGAYEEALPHAWRQVELGPWQEEGHRQLMRVLFGTGRHAEALAQYKAHQRALAEELGFEPDTETTRLYEQIRNGKLELMTELPVVAQPEPAPSLPYFLEQEAEAVAPPVFVARERQLARLDAFLDSALAGQGQVAFVTGGPGRGKTTLLAEFGRRAMEAHPDLLVASGNCNAYSGVGDPYLPFRDILGLLTGDVEARWAAGSISRDHARRLWAALPQAVEALVDHGSHLSPALIPGTALLSRARAAVPAETSWLHRLAERLERLPVPSSGLEQSHLFEQVTLLLRAMAEAHPLLLILDDLQWADTASVGLLFHLGRRLEGTRILIAGAYRPVEVALGRGGARHPLEKVLSEFKRTFGDVWLDLTDVDELERRRFVDGLIETEPNRLGESFRRVLTEHTGGHPLFTAELLRAMQARGDLFRDEAGRWTHGPVLDWETLPARVEGAIEARIGELEPELREILSVASVEGEDFAVPVVAQVQDIEESVLLRRLAQDLAKRHKLVMEQAEVKIGPRRIQRFKFSHVLVQSYLYQQLSLGERRLLHGKVASALESCYRDRVDEYAVQLAHHHDRAGDDGRALYYYTRAAENAHRVYANEEAYRHYTRAIEAAKRIPVDTPSVIRIYLGRGLVCQTLGDFDGALAGYESALGLAQSTDEDRVEHLKWRALVELGRLWTSRDYLRAYDHFQDALQLAQRMSDPVLLAGSLNWVGNWYLNAENPRAAITHHQEALTIFEKLGDRRGLATTLDLLGIASLLCGDITAMVEYYDRAIALFRELGDLTNLASSLTGRGHAACSTYTLLTLVRSAVPIHPGLDLEEAAHISREIGSPASEAWVLWSMGLLCIAQGRYGQALESALESVQIATQIGHRESMVTSQCALGLLYTELLMPEQARHHLEVALALAEELHNRALVRWATGTLAASYCQLGDLARAESRLDTVLSSEPPMDTMYVRYCWARRAELALAQSEPALALDITERLIDSAPRMSSGCVITFLWKLKGEALAAMGHTGEAHLLLHAAMENARATGEQFLAWRIHASLARVCQAIGRQSEAGKELSIARQVVEELASTLPNGELRDNFSQRAQDRLSLPYRDVS